MSKFPSLPQSELFGKLFLISFVYNNQNEKRVTKNTEIKFLYVLFHLSSLILYNYNHHKK